MLALFLAIALAQSTDVRSLERVATDPSAKKSDRSEAYARLGELGTAESIAAIDRIEKAAKQWRPSDLMSPGAFTTPGFHFSDSELITSVAAEQNGVRYAVFVDWVFGDMDLLLISQKGKQWTRPHLVPLKLYRGMHDVSLKAGAAGTLVFSFTQDKPPARAIMEGTQERGEASPKLGPQQAVIDIAATLRDSDGDGITDVEEARLGLDASNPDSDRDRIPDGDDIAPDFAPSPSDDTTLILQRAFFATFGLSYSRYHMFLAEDSTPIQPWGYRAFVVRHKHPVTYGAVSIRWKILKRDDTTAVVEIVDSERPLAAGSMNVTLTRKHGSWYVTAVTPGWVA